MEFKKERDRIFLEGEAGSVIAEVTFPPVSRDVVNINHTFVDDSLRGQGIAGKLMEEAAAELRREGKKALLTCSYAIRWFEKNEEYQDLVYKP